MDNFLPELQYGLGTALVLIGAFFIYWCAQPEFLKGHEKWTWNIIWPFRFIGFLLGANFVVLGFAVMNRSEMLFNLIPANWLYALCVFLAFIWCIKALMKTSRHKLDKSVDDKKDSK